MLRPTVWNSLPSFVRTADSFTSFRSQLKTYMFTRHFVASPLSVPLIPLCRFFVRYKFVTYLLTYVIRYFITKVLSMQSVLRRFPFETVVKLVKSRPKTF